MTDSQPHGRTGWDFATEAIKSRTTIALVVVVGLLVPGFVHVLAEPGTEIFLVGGLVKYQKAKGATEAPEPVRTVPPSTKDYLLPSTKDLRSDPTPILDGTINLGALVDSKDGAYFMSGANIDLVAFAIRTPRGDALAPKVVGRKVHVELTDTFLELEYKGNFFVVETEMQRGDEGTFVMTVKKLEAPTLKLKKFAEYAGG